MNLYGEELLLIGILLIIAALVAAAVFLVIYLITSRSLKKQLEREYGKKNK